MRRSLDAALCLAAYLGWCAYVFGEIALCAGKDRRAASLPAAVLPGCIVFGISYFNDLAVRPRSCTMTSTPTGSSRRRLGQTSGQIRLMLGLALIR